MRVFRLPFLALAYLCPGILSVFPVLLAQDYSAPVGYYADAEQFLGDDLRETLHTIIDGHTNLTYDAMRIAPRVLDADPDVPDNIILIYSGESIEGFRFNTLWNREHSWPQSYGADSSTMPGADFHHLFPANPATNSSRSNLIFDWTSPGDLQNVPNAPGSTRDGNSFEPRDEDKGRIARAMLYMDLRYATEDGFGDFKLAESANQSATQMAKLSTLLEWHRLFPPDQRELRRNHLIYAGFEFASFTYKQGNRNPFIDFPDLVDAVFTSDQRIAWGTWRWIHFSLEQLEGALQTGPLDDPDEDFLVNLMEYSANLDPQEPNTNNLLTVFSIPGFGSQLRYTRQLGTQTDGVSYAIESSPTPLREETWMPLGQDDISGESTSQTGMTELVTVTVPETTEPTWYRLSVSREAGETPAVAVFDPIRTYDTSGSLFVYQNTIQQTPWKESPWMGYVIDGDYPWVYHLEHKWIYMEADRDDRVWFLDSALEWVFTSADYYPYLYHLSSDEWVYFLQTSSSPNRWFYSASAGWLMESEIGSLITN